MITKEEVINLANLARIKVTDEEVEKLTKEVDAILGYVGQIQEVTKEVEKTAPKLRNVMRDDVVTNKDNEYTERLLDNAPNRDGKYLKVKKIL